MIIGPAIKQENFRPLNSDINEIEKVAFTAAIFIKTELLEIYLISISFCVSVIPPNSAFTKYIPLGELAASQTNE